MSIEVKICGLRTPAALAAALDAGADYVGLVHYPRSPRHVEVEAAAALAAAARGRALSVVLLVDPDDDLLGRIVADVSPDLIQLHGRETPHRLRQIRAAAGRRIIKAVSVATRADVDAGTAFLHPGDLADIILFDARPPADPAALPGGNGLAFDWRILDGLAGRASFALAGGLTPENVGDAIRLAHPAIVDVSSGVETAPGVKSAALIRTFIEAARAAAHPARSEPAPSGRET